MNGVAVYKDIFEMKNLLCEHMPYALTSFGVKELK